MLKLLEQNKSHRLESKEKPLIKVSRLRFLVHPGYIKDTIGQYNAGQLSRAEALPSEYKNIARGLAHDEVMIVLVHQMPPKFREDVGARKAYATTIEEFKKLAENKKQIIVLTGDTAPFSGADEEYDMKALEKVRSVARARGYDINKETSVEVFGEMRNECVQEAYNGITNAGFFEAAKVNIVGKLTDRPERG